VVDDGECKNEDKWVEYEFDCVSGREKGRFAANMGVGRFSAEGAESLILEDGSAEGDTGDLGLEGLLSRGDSLS